MTAAELAPELLGPLGALALAVVMLGLFYMGRILPRNTVPREDYEKLQAVNVAISEGLRVLTRSVDELVTVVKYQQRNGKPP